MTHVITTASNSDDVYQSTSDVTREAEASQQSEQRRHLDLGVMACQDSDAISPLGTAWNI